MARPRVLFALTAHGLGHLTRSLAVARALRRSRPQVELAVTGAPSRERVVQELGEPCAWSDVAYEPGVAQRSCFELDVPGTRALYRRWERQRPGRLETERRRMVQEGYAAVVSDVPALPVAAAAAAGIPALALASFTWDWILEPLLGPAGRRVCEGLAADYARGRLHLQLPLGPEHSPFARVERVPLVARRARLPAAEVRRRLGLPADGRSLVVVCPGGWDPEHWPAIRVAGCTGIRFIAVGDLPLQTRAPLLSLPHRLPCGISFPDLVAAADAVLAKPGYGMASECALHGTALVAVERPEFRETPVLLAGFRKLAPLAALSLADFFGGAWEPALRAALGAAAPRDPPAADGAEQVARRLAWHLGLDEPPEREPSPPGEATAR